MTAAEYNTCVEDYADRLFRYVLKNIRQESDARDIVQQSFERLWRKHSEVDAAKAKSYLFTTAYHALVDWVRARKRTVLEAPPPEADPASEHSAFEARDHLDKALAALSPIQRQVLLLRDYEGYAYKEIAEMTGLTDAQVKVYIFRARKKAQQVLRPQPKRKKRLP